ncbi:MAG: DUF1257 domain-containing protein [Cyanobacteria bacterium]|nr:DUF1257 domain-containing protein [Cyanobacteria bacterium CG_2015-16_32_12]NCO79649.1 DUF1257 domain-containing protein [Cyanobacteria bacterium CG_2015-22_32_23]
MSHFTAVKTKFTDKETLIKSLKNMGFMPEIHDEGINLNNRWGTTDIAHIVIPSKQLGERCGADLGFKLNDSCYEITADEFEMAYSNYSNFKQDLGTEYACLMAEKKGYKILSRERGSNGKMQIKITPPQTIKIRR